MSDEPEDDETLYELVLPFVCCESNGGPYEDAAFCAGARFGGIDHTLRVLTTIGVLHFHDFVEIALVEQLDLLAMHLGWKMISEPWGGRPDDWARVMFDWVADE